MKREQIRPSRAWPSSRVPADLVAVIALIALANLVVFLPVTDGSFGRTVVGVVFVLFVPGYALVAALFPEAGRSPTTSETGASGTDRGRYRMGDAVGTTLDRIFTSDYDRDDRGIDGLERVALSFGLSIAIVPLIVVCLTFSPFELVPVSILATISVFTVACTVVAAVRRAAVPEDVRFRVPYRAWVSKGKEAVTDANSRFDAVLNVTLAVVILVAVVTLAFAVVAAPDGERFTDFYVLTEDDDGELAATGYPEVLTPGDPEQLHVGIENYERDTVEYSVVVQLQRVEGDANESTVTQRTEVDRLSTTLSHNETSIRAHDLSVSDELTGDDLRLTYLLYDDSVPETPTSENAYHALHFWVDVEASAE